MKTVICFETLVLAYQTTHCRTLQDQIRGPHSRQNLRSRIENSATTLVFVMFRWPAFDLDRRDCLHCKNSVWQWNGCAT
jgi:hypothetical protein